MQFYNLKTGLRASLSIILALAFSSCAIGQNVSDYDLSTNEGVNAARETIAGKKLHNYSKGCIKRPSELPEIILVGTFAHDRGCMLEGAFVKKYFIPAKEENFSRAALKKLGWLKAHSAGEREEMALRWTQFGLLAFGGYPIIKAGEEDFKDREFQSPETAADQDKNVTVTLWTRLPTGMRCETNYHRLSFIFSADGSLKERKSVDSFSIPCRRN